MSATEAYDTREGSEITNYPDFAVEYREKSHRYWLLQESKRRSVPSVTGATKVLDKVALIPWAERMGAEGALRLERDGQLHGVQVEDAIYRVRELDEGAEAIRNAGAKRGTAIHDALRIYCQDGYPPRLGNFDEDVREYVSALCRWLLDVEPEPVLSEQVVGSVVHGYAGRFDLLAKIDGVLTAIDLKTSKGKARVFREAHVQVAGYEIAMAECGLPAHEQTLIVALGEDGSIDSKPSVGTPEQFLSVLDCSRQMKELEATLRKHEREAA
jgi:hypothetical protein